MSGLSFVDVIGLIAGGLGIVSFLENNIPSLDDQPEGTAVAIKAGIARIDDDVGGMGGKISAVYGYDMFNEYIGQADGQSVADGDQVTFTLDQASPGKQTDFIGIANNDDATCISWIAVNMHDGSKGGAWTGDVGANCGQRWHMGNQRAGTLPNSDEDYIPRCSWFDDNFTDGTKSAAMKFRVHAYGEHVNDTVAQNTQCTSTIFGRDDGPISGQPAKKRSISARPQWVQERLIVSHISGQAAEDLCSSETSWGPDFVGTDGKFCDMSTKELLPLCSSKDIDGCVHVSEPEKTITKKSTIARRQVNTTHKSYKTVTHNTP